MKRYLKGKFLVAFTDGSSAGNALLRTQTKRVTRGLINRIGNEFEKDTVIQNIVRIY